MQRKEKARKDARSFPVIYESCSAADKALINRELSYQLHKTSTTIYHWRKGNHYPTDMTLRNAAADLVCKLLNIEATADTLFPLSA